MKLRVRTVDAFTDQPFGGNPAGVLRLDELTDPPSERWCAAVAAELNLSETAFLFATDRPDADFQLRWFTPTVEVELCGHATLAMSHCLFSDGRPGPIRYSTRSGVLIVDGGPNGSITMDFPAQPPVEAVPPPGLERALGASVRWCGTGGGDYLVELSDAATVRLLQPDLAAIAALPARGVIVTAAGTDAAGADRVDFVSRFFGPAVGVPEDPVTGSAHTVLGPYWAARLGRTDLVGRQLSARSGEVGVAVGTTRVQLSGRAVTVIDGTIELPEPA